ncbi:hypothetical protein F5Y15DRAFT_285311 [Xylariaceae sp. FL0016]|nr:hypothetical protein F5Y15DRAFT_285311 [Xylariaceae sp. FL0016]
MAPSSDDDTKAREALAPTATGQVWRDSRLSIPPLLRIPAAAITSFGIGMSLGLAHGSKMAGLRFRAEHAHRLPTTTTGWYLYHKSKNYHLAFGGLKEGVKVGARLSVLSTAMFCAENLFDVYRGTKDFLNTIMASLAIAGGFSLWNGFSAAETARTARKGLKFGLAYGCAQDIVSLLRGRPVGYIDFIRKHLGKTTQMQEDKTVL